MPNFRSEFRGTPLGMGAGLPPEARAVSRFCQIVADEFQPGADFSDITLRFFKTIQDDAELMNLYLTLESRMGRHALNSSIGRWIKESYSLEEGKQVTAPEGMLIKSYTAYPRSSGSSAGRT